MTLEDLIDLQAERDIKDIHLVYIGDDGFRIAHTDSERASETSLWECGLHEYLCGLDEALVEPGVYSVGDIWGGYALIPFT